MAAMKSSLSTRLGRWLIGEESGGGATTAGRAARGLAEAGSEGSLIELGQGFLQDGDTVVLRGVAGDTVSLGEVAGTIVP